MFISPYRASYLLLDSGLGLPIFGIDVWHKSNWIYTPIRIPLFIRSHVYTDDCSEFSSESVAGY